LSIGEIVIDGLSQEDTSKINESPIDSRQSLVLSR